MSRKQPNILVTGTPGTGKTTTCQQVIEAIGFTHINVGDWVKQQELHSGWDEEHDCYIIDEDKVFGSQLICKSTCSLSSCAACKCLLHFQQFLCHKSAVCCVLTLGLLCRYAML